MSDLRVVDFDYELPEELIAQEPPAERGASRMLVIDRASGGVRDSTFSEFPSLLREGDLLVLNDSRVIPARLFARRTLRREKEKPTGRIEVMLTEPAGENQWHALVRPGRKVAIGECLVFPTQEGTVVLEAEVLERGQYGDRLLQFAPVADFFGMRLRIASAIRLCFRANVARWLRRLPACTSRRRCWKPFRGEASRLRALRYMLDWVHLRRFALNASMRYIFIGSATAFQQKPPMR
jgi:hypothetical protein